MNKAQSRKISTAVCLVAALAWMTLIFMMSARDATLSTQDSHRIGWLIGRWLIWGFQEWPAPRQYRFVENIDFFVRKTAHATEYAVLAALWTGVTAQGAKHRRCGWLPAWGIAVVYAATDEIHQYFVPGRACRLMDVGIDSAGALAGCLLVWGISRWWVSHRLSKNT